MQRAPIAKNKVLFLIDEAADLGKLTHLPDWLATLRKYNVVLWPIFQNMGQLVELYGRGWQTLVANCGMLQFLGFGNDLETTEHTERLLGKCTVQTVSTNPKGERSLAQVARSLHTSDELRRLHKNWQIVLIGNLPPMGLMKTPYWKRPELAGRFNPNPYHPGKSRLGLMPRLRALWGRFYYLQVCVMAPHPIAALIWTGLFAAALLAVFGLLPTEGLF
jgi:type IV secretion system protein VirD4